VVTTDNPKVPRRTLGHTAGRLVTAAYVMLIMAGLWTACVWTVRQSVAQASAEALNAHASLRVNTVRDHLQRNDLTAARRLVSDAVADLGLLGSRLVLPTGEVVADHTPALISVRSLPPEWLEAGLDFTNAPVPGQTVVPFELPGRGWLRLELIADPARQQANLLPLHATFALGTVVLLAGITFVARRSSKRMRGAEEIHQALIALDRGETDLAILQISESIGSEVRAWNTLLQTREDEGRAALVTRTGTAAAALGGRSSGQLFAACDALPNGLVVVDAQQNVRFSNGAAVMMLRLGDGDLVGKPFADLIADASVATAVHEAVAGGRKRSKLEFERAEDGNTSWFRVNVRPLRRDDGGGAVVTVEDVTQARTAEQARDTFIAQATHELRTPLTNICLYVEAAIDAGDDAVTRSASLNVINEESRRLERIVGDMLSVSEIQAGSFKVEMRDVRLDALFDKIHRDFEAQAVDKRIKLTFHLPPKFPVARGDRDKIEIAIQNLVGNAIKYTPAGGRVDVSVESTEQLLSIAVKDTGFGISPDALPRLFSRFFRADDPRVREVTGTGLGLALARDVVRLHGGDITVDSQLNKGSTFTMTLPLGIEVHQPC
jgi:PAS domain S-box-containing protein